MRIVKLSSGGFRLVAQDEGDRKQLRNIRAGIVVRAGNRYLAGQKERIDFVPAEESMPSHNAFTSLPLKR